MTAAPNTTLAVVIPTFRRPEMLQSLLASLSRGRRIPDEVIVVDNDPIASAAPHPVPGLNVRVLKAGLGISVAGARNAGWRASTSDLVVFIDDDNVVEPDAIANLAQAFRADGVGLAGPVIYAGDTGTVWCGGVRRSPWTGRTQNLLGGRTALPDRPDWPTEDMPDAFAVPRPVLADLGGFDERRFPIHYEEADLGARIRARGLRTVVVRDAAVRHYGWVGLSPGGALVRATAGHGRGRTRQMALSRIRFHIEYSRGLQRVSTVGIFIPIWAVVTGLGCLVAKAPLPTRLATMKALGSGLVAGYREALPWGSRVQDDSVGAGGRRPTIQ
jgi:GT2 family glycosyltransferase